MALGKNVSIRAMFVCEKVIAEIELIYWLTLSLLTWRIWCTKNVRKWQMVFISAFKGFKYTNKSFRLISPNCSDDSWGTSAHTANSISVCAVPLFARHNTSRA